MTDGCSDDEGVGCHRHRSDVHTGPAHLVKGDVGGRGGGGTAFYGAQQGVIGERGFGVSMEPGVVFGSVNAPVPLGPYVAPPPTFTEPDKAVTRRMGSCRAAWTGCGRRPGFRAGCQPSASRGTSRQGHAKNTRTTRARRRFFPSFGVGKPSAWSVAS